jgi:hypothetical protein
MKVARINDNPALKRFTEESMAPNPTVQIRAASAKKRDWQHTHVNSVR